MRRVIVLAGYCLVAATPALAADGDVGRVCRAAIASINGRDAAIIKVDKIEDGIAYVSYKRPDDGKKWKNRCRLEGNKVIWAAVDLDGPGSGPGRWRNDPADEVITYKIDGDSITITQTFGDGSDITETVKVP